MLPLLKNEDLPHHDRRRNVQLPPYGS